MGKIGIGVWRVEGLPKGIREEERCEILQGWIFVRGFFFPFSGGVLGV